MAQLRRYRQSWILVPALAISATAQGAVFVAYEFTRPIPEPVLTIHMDGEGNGSVRVMRDGVIEQAGNPDALYNNPDTRFTASFIGAPPMNCFQHPHHPSHVCGVRPEHIDLVSNIDPIKEGHIKLSAFVETVEYLGADSLVSLKMNDNRLVARVAGHCRLQPSSPVWVTWHEKHQYFFDSQSGTRLALKP